MIHLESRRRDNERHGQPAAPQGAPHDERAMTDGEMLRQLLREVEAIKGKLGDTSADADASASAAEQQQAKKKQNQNQKQVQTHQASKHAVPALQVENALST